jgi:hypothetical protein
MYEVLKTEKFAVFFSFMVGIAIIGILIPTCKGDSCTIKKAPSMDEMKNSTFTIGSKCYQFKSKTIECPASGTIESFINLTPAPFNNTGTPGWTMRDTVAFAIVLGLSLAAAWQQ